MPNDGREEGGGVGGGRGEGGDTAEVRGGKCDGVNDGKGADML